MYIDEQIWIVIYCLWDEMVELFVFVLEVCLNKLFIEISVLIDLCYGLWLFFLCFVDDVDNDLLLGWWVCLVFFYGELLVDQQVYIGVVKWFDKGILDELIQNYVCQVGVFWVILLVDYVFEGFYFGDYYIYYYLGCGIIDCLFVVMLVNEDVESYFMFDWLCDQFDFIL